MPRTKPTKITTTPIPYTSPVIKEPIKVPTLNEALANPVNYFILVHSRVNLPHELKRMKQSHRTCLYVIHRTQTDLKTIIKRLEDAFRNPSLADFEDLDSDDEFDVVRKKAQHKRFLHQLTSELRVLKMYSNQPNKQGIMATTNGFDIDTAIKYAKLHPKLVHCIATCDSDNLQSEYWGAIDTPLLLPSAFDHDEIASAAVETGSWK